LEVWDESWSAARSRHFLEEETVMEQRLLSPVNFLAFKLRMPDSYLRF
jgi:hypothetical protein